MRRQDRAHAGQRRHRGQRLRHVRVPDAGRGRQAEPGVWPGRNGRDYRRDGAAPGREINHKRFARGTRRQDRVGERHGGCCQGRDQRRGQGRRPHHGQHARICGAQGRLGLPRARSHQGRSPRRRPGGHAGDHHGHVALRPRPEGQEPHYQQHRAARSEPD